MRLRLTPHTDFVFFLFPFSWNDTCFDLSSFSISSFLSKYPVSFQIVLSSLPSSEKAGVSLLYFLLWALTVGKSLGFCAEGSGTWVWVVWFWTSAWLLWPQAHLLWYDVSACLLESVKMKGDDACKMFSTQEAEAFLKCQMPLPPTSARVLSLEYHWCYLSTNPRKAFVLI
jgi:hypothetical protein